MTPGSPLAGAERKMAELLASGGRVVVGSSAPIDNGVTLGKYGERHIVVKCRSTRQVFLELQPPSERRIHLRPARAPAHVRVLRK